MNAGWQGVFVGVGAVLISLSLIFLIERYWNFIRTNAKDLAILAFMALMVILSGIGFYYLVFVHDPTRTVWTHPTLSPAEQSQASAGCQMKAYEAIKGRRIADDVARSDYFDACLISLGFESHEVKSSVLENAK
ncbi:MAG: hypothetical protein OXH09_21155 [Gammaproteobacteria bacterium]|nr:hypothetical protein [Gammaproteobacteria bacterium]